MELTATTQEGDLWSSGALKSLAQRAAASKKANKKLHINRNNTENKTEFWYYILYLLAHPQLQWRMRCWCAHLRRDMWKGQGQPRGHRGGTTALQGEVRTPPLFERGTGGEPGLLVCPRKATVIPPLRMCLTFTRLWRSWEKWMQTCYSQNPTIWELWSFMKRVGGEFKADESKHLLTQQAVTSCRHLLPWEVSEANSVSRFKSAYANFLTSL